MRPATHSIMTFRKPQKCIKQQADMATFEASVAYQRINRFLVEMTLSAKGQARNPAQKWQDLSRPALRTICEILNELRDAIEEFPPVDQNSRFGNKSYRDWFDFLEKNSEDYCKRILAAGDAPQSASAELAEYFLHSFGNRTRIDYGTGHELTFLCFLCILASPEVNCISKEAGDYVHVALVIFWEYIQLMQKLQTVYWLEPAGSHGVWGLDDYQFIPFIIGAAQLIDHDHYTPNSIHDESALRRDATHYFYFECVRYVKSIKKGIFAEHSPMLNDISAVPRWSKVHSGLLKMYAAEVLAKLQIVQHLLFGSVLRFAAP